MYAISAVCHEGCFVVILQITQHCAQTIINCFVYLQTLYGVHTEFCKELYDACQNTDSSQSTYSISQCFLKYKSQFLVYGDFCSNLPQAQELVDSLCMRDPRVADRIMVGGIDNVVTMH